jgi:hypothetical protein
VSLAISAARAPARGGGYAACRLARQVPGRRSLDDYVESLGYPFCVKYSGDSPVEYPDYDSDEEQQPEPFDLEAVNRRLAALGSGQP